MSKYRKFYGWTLVAVLWFIYFVNASFPMYGGSVINSYMANVLNMDRTTLGLGFTFFGLLHGLPGVLIALSINKKGVRFTLFLGSVIITLGALLMGITVNSALGYIIVYGCIIGLGVGFGAMIPVQTGVTLWFKKKRALALSIVLTAAGIGGFIASPTVNKIITAANENWHAAWIFVAGMSALAAVVSILFVKDKPSDIGQLPDGISDSELNTKIHNIKTSNVYQTKDDWTVKEALRTTSFWLVFIGAIGFFAPYYIFLAHGVINLLDKGIPSDIAAMSMGLITLFSIAGRLIAGFLGDRIEPRYIFSMGLIFYIVGCIIASNVSSIAGVYFYAISIGIGFGTSYVCLSTIYGNYYGSKVFASILGIVFPFMTAVGSISPVIAGMVYDYSGSYTSAFIGAGIISLLGVICLLYSKPPIKNINFEREKLILKS